MLVDILVKHWPVFVSDRPLLGCSDGDAWCFAFIPPAAFDEAIEGSEEDWVIGVAGSEADVGGGVPVEGLFWVRGEEGDYTTD